jgi:hypothetical protein
MHNYLVMNHISFFESLSGVHYFSSNKNDMWEPTFSPEYGNTDPNSVFYHANLGVIGFI